MATGRPLEQSAGENLDQLIAELRDVRGLYSALIERLRSHAGKRDEDVKQRYAEIYREVEESELHARLPVDGTLRARFRDAVSRIFHLVARIQDWLIVQSVRSEEGRRLLKAFKKLPLGRGRIYLVESSPVRTLEGLDSLIALLQLTTQREKAEVSRSEPRAKTATKSTEASEIPPTSTRRKEPHPDPDSVLRANPGGLTYQRAADVLGVGVRRVQMLVREGALEAKGKGNAKRLTVESFKKYLNHTDDLAKDSEKSRNRK